MRIKRQKLFYFVEKIENEMKLFHLGTVIQNAMGMVCYCVMGVILGKINAFKCGEERKGRDLHVNMKRDIFTAITSKFNLKDFSLIFHHWHYFVVRGLRHEKFLNKILNFV